MGSISRHGEGRPASRGSPRPAAVRTKAGTAKLASFLKTTLIMRSVSPGKVYTGKAVAWWRGEKARAFATVLVQYTFRLVSVNMINKLLGEVTPGQTRLWVIRDIISNVFTKSADQ